MAQRDSTAAAGERERLVRQYRDLLGEYKTVNAELADRSWTLAELEQQIAALEAAAAPGDRRAAGRLRALRHWRGTLEEQVLAHMYRAEAIAAELARLRAALER
ncbi:MAG: hypothetical protein HXY37_16985 [Chloroflexi bacterium]|nr:hypothetical protein [Chloroflexota bacterium]